MTDDVRLASDYVVLTEEPNVMRAQLVAGRLHEAGIPTFVDQDHLADEFAVSQKVLGLLRVRVLVPQDRLDEAREIFLAMSQPIPLVEEDDEDDEEEEEDQPSHLSTRAAIAVVAVTIALLCGMFALVASCQPSTDDPLSSGSPMVPEPPRPPPAAHPPQVGEPAATRRTASGGGSCART